jgi:hypothetical protein
MAQKRSLFACAACIFLLVTISQFPLRLALSLALRNNQALISADAVTGTLWAGRAQGVTFAGQPLGDVTVRTSFVNLLSGGNAAQITWRGRSQSGTALVALGDDAIALSQIESRMVLAQSGLSGIAKLVDGNIIYENQDCVAASGDVAVTLQDQESSYAGGLNCMDGALVLSITMNGVVQRIPLMGEGQ